MIWLFSVEQIMASLLKAPTNNTLQLHKLDLFTGSSRINRQSSNSGNGNVAFSRKRSLVPPVLSMSATGASTKEHLETPMSKNLHIPIMVLSHINLLLLVFSFGMR